MAKIDVPKSTSSAVAVIEESSAPEAQASPSTTVTDSQLLDAFKVARTAVRGLDQKEVEIRKDFRNQQDALRVLLKRAQQVPELKVLADNALSNGLLDTSDRASFMQLSEQLVTELAVRYQL